MWAHQPSPESSQQLYWVLKVMAGIAKSTTTPAHKTTLYYGAVQRISQPPHETTLQAAQPISRPATYAVQPPIPELNKANESHCRVSKPDRKTIVPNYSAFGIY